MFTRKSRASWWFAGILLAVGVTWGALRYHEWRNPPPVHEGQPVPQWVRELGDANYQVAHRAQMTIPEIGPEATPYLIQLIEQPESKLDTFRNSVARRFTWLRLKPYDYTRARSTAVQLLGQIAPGDALAVPALVKALGDKDQAMAVAAREALSQAGEVAVEPLTKALKHPDTTVRFLATSALADLGPHTAPAVPALLEALHDDVPELRSAAIVALTRSGVEPKEILPALIYLLNDKVVTVRLDAINAIGSFNADAALATEPLAKALLDAEPWVRSSAAFALGQIGSAAKVAEPALIKALQDAAIHPRISAANALWKINQQSAPLVPVYVAALRDQDARNRNYAAQGLLLLGAPAYPHTREILDALKSEFEPGRYHSVLRVLGDADDSLLPIVEPLLQDPDVRLRGAALFIIGRMAEKRPQLRAVLATATKDTDSTIREAAERILRNLPATVTSP